MIEHLRNGPFTGHPVDSVRSTFMSAFTRVSALTAVGTLVVFAVAPPPSVHAQDPQDDQAGQRTQARQAEPTPSAEPAAVRGVPEARATLTDQEGNTIGEAMLQQSPSEGVLISLRLDGAPPGTHALHVHETGECEPTFSAAGGHYAPEGDDHGFLHGEGPHAGDLPNLNVPSSGTLEVEIFAPDLSLLDDEENTLFDDDGSALVMHEGGDDYWSQPSGEAGSEIACGEIMGAIEP